MASRLLAFILLAVSVASSQNPKVNPVLPKGPFKPYYQEMLAVLKADSRSQPGPRRLSDKLEETTWNGHRAYRRESASSLTDQPPFVRFEITVFDADTLLPLHGEWRRNDGLFLTRDFNGLHVTETRSEQNVLSSPRVAGGEAIKTVTAEYDMPSPAYDWIGGAGLPVVMGLPLRDGLDGSVPAISGDKEKMAPCVAGPCFVRDMHYHVTGPEMVKGISGEMVKSWKVDVPDTKFIFWIACDNPRLAQVQWPGPGGNGTFSMTGVGK